MHCRRPDGHRSRLSTAPRRLYLFGAANDLLPDARTGLPTDHTGTFAAVTGIAWTTHQPTAGYITLLERGYALHSSSSRSCS